MSETDPSDSKWKFTFAEDIFRDLARSKRY